MNDSKYYGTYHLPRIDRVKTGSIYYSFIKILIQGRKNRSLQSGFK